MLAPTIIFIAVFLPQISCLFAPQSAFAQSTTLNSRNISLVEAAKSGDEKELERLLRDGVAPDVIEDGTKRTPLHYATQRGQPGMVRLLIERRADPNLKDSGGMTPLMIIAQNPSKLRNDIARMLIGAKADLDARSLYGDTAVRLAADKGFTDTVLLLIDNGAASERQSALNLALLRAAENGKIVDVNQLLGRGADPNVQPTAYKPSGEIAFRADTPLILAIAGAHDHVIQALLGAKANLNLSGSGGKTPLIVAVHKGPKYTRWMLERGAGPNVTDDIGRTALMHVMTSGNSPADQKELVQLLKNAGADVDAKDKNGDSATRIALANGRVDLLPLLGSGGKMDRQAWHNEALALARRQRLSEIETLLSKSDTPNITDPQGKSALMIAAAQGRTEMMHALLEAGSNINQQDKDGLTALMHAVRSRRLGATELLLLAKANPNIKNKTNETALIIALPTRHESYGVRKLDLAAHNNPLVPLMAALLKAGADPNIRLRDGITPLMIAASREAEPVVKLLLAYGADVNAKTELGLIAYHVAMGEEVINILKAARGLEKPTGPSKVESTILNNLLFEAAERGNTDLVRKLIVEEGADPNFRTQYWREPVLYAAIRSRRASTVETLLKLGADPNISHQTLGSPIAHARKHLKPDVLPEVMKVLIAAGASPEPAK